MNTSTARLQGPIFCALLGASAGAGATTIALWDFEEGTPGQVASGASSVLDVAGGHHGTPFGGNGPVYAATGAGDTGLRFDGINDGVVLADSADFSNDSLTVEAVVSLDQSALSGLRQIVFRGDSRNGQDPFYLAVLDGHLRWYIEGPNAGAVALHSPDLLPTDELLHVAGTIDGGTGDMQLFINGVEVANVVTDRRPTLPLFSSARVSIGSLDDGFGQGQYLPGLIGAVCISDVALSPSDFLCAAAAVPEPLTGTLVVAGLLGALARRRRH